MFKRTQQGLRAGGVLLFACVTALAAGSAQAADRTGSIGQGAAQLPHASYASVGDATRAPIGWVEFCVEYKGECDTKPSQPRDIVLTPKAWTDLVKVNDWVNETIKPMTDLDHWGVVERWNYPDDGYGDCEDYVLQKRRMLMKAGWPREALLITVVRDTKGDGHAVLTVKTSRGEFILDNERNEIVAWDKTGYRFVKRQSQSDPNTWVSLGEPRTAPAYVSAR
jgi:predicted transglutaminase-like cysteine proteinase